MKLAENGTIIKEELTQKVVKENFLNAQMRNLIGKEIVSYVTPITNPRSKLEKIGAWQ